VSPPSPTRLFRQRNFRLLWIGETISGAGSSMAVVGVPLAAVTVLRASTLTVAALTAAAYLPWLVIGLPAGAWVDRLPVRPLMIGCDAVSALLYASLPVAAWLGMLSTGQFVAVVLLGGTANVFFATAYQVCLPTVVSAAELVPGNARLQGGASVATVAGRGLGGVAAQAVGAVPALGFNAASFVVSAFCLLRIRATVPSDQSKRADGVQADGVQADGVRTETWRGICFVARDPYLRPLTIYATIANLAYTGNLALVVIFLVRVVGLSSATVGLLMATGGIGGVSGALAAPRLTRACGTARTLVLTVVGTGLSGLLIPLTARGSRLACYVTGSVLIAGGLVVANVIAASFRQEYCPPAMLGRVTASMRFLAFGMIPLGALLAGALGTALGVRNGLWTVLVIFATSSLFLLTPRIRTARNLPPTPARTERKSAPTSPLRSPEMS
jgi:predicted MFS family arabinose efflux permease